MEIPVRKRLEVVKLYLDGFSYDDISSRIGVSKGSVVNILNEFREGRIPGLETARDKADEMRELAVRFKKQKLVVEEVALGLRFLDRLNQLGVAPGSLEQWLKLCETMSISEEERRGLIQGAITLRELESELGQPYRELLQQLQTRRQELDNLTEQIEKARERRRAVDQEIGLAEGSLASASSQLDVLVKTEERLGKLALGKVAQLAQFAEECEALGFEAQRVKRLADIEKEMVATGIKPGDLRGFLKEKGSFAVQIGALKREKLALEEVISNLKWERRTEEELLEQAKRENSTLSHLADRKVALRCKLCSKDIMALVSSPDQYREMMRSNQCLAYSCPHCRGWSFFSPWEMLAEVGFQALEAKDILGPRLSKSVSWGFSTSAM